jgi:hypothetical protein
LIFLPEMATSGIVLAGGPAVNRPVRAGSLGREVLPYTRNVEAGENRTAASAEERTDRTVDVR